MGKSLTLAGPQAPAVAGPRARHPGVRRILLRLARLRLRNREFSIISNNCWGAHIYQGLRLPFATPFIGLFLSPASYLRLLAAYPRCLAPAMEFKSSSDEAWINQLREEQGNPWPIGQLGEGIEIHFMHYKSVEEAAEKWRRRLGRLATQPDRLFVKFCDRDESSPEQLAAFDQLPFPNKVYFTVQKDCALRCAVRIPLAEARVPHGRMLSDISPDYFDSMDWLNGGTGRIGRWNRWLSCI